MTLGIMDQLMSRIPTAAHRLIAMFTLAVENLLVLREKKALLKNMMQTQHRLSSLWLRVDEQNKQVVAGYGGEAEEDEVDDGEEVADGEGGPVGGEQGPGSHLHTAGD